MRPRALLVWASLAPLAACANTPSPEVEAEVLRREAFARAVSDDAGTALRWNVSGSADVVYADGFSLLLHDPPENVRSPAFRWMGQNSYVHLRTRGGRPHALRILGWCHLKEMRTRPVVTAYIDRQTFATTGIVGEDGHWSIDAVVPPSMFRGKEWVDLELTVSAVAYYWTDPPVLRVAALNKLVWSELP